jgi:hypothetical protein
MRYAPAIIFDSTFGKESSVLISFVISNSFPGRPPITSGTECRFPVQARLYILVSVQAAGVRLFRTSENQVKGLRGYSNIPLVTCNPAKFLAKLQLRRSRSIIFLKGGIELGRIIENPKDTMEADFLAIVGVK